MKAIKIRVDSRYVLDMLKEDLGIKIPIKQRKKFCKIIEESVYVDENFCPVG